MSAAARTRRWRIVALLVALLAAAVVAASEFSARREHDHQRDREHEALAAAVRATPPGQALDLASAVPGDWDHVLIAGPYMPKQAIRKASDGRLPPELEHLDLGVDEGVNLLVFLQKDVAGKSIELSRIVADFDDAQLLRQVPRARAQLVRAASGVAFSWLKP